MGLKWKRPQGAISGKPRLKSDQNGIEIRVGFRGRIGGVSLKSDQNGIEIGVKYAFLDPTQER